MKWVKTSSKVNIIKKEGEISNCLYIIKEGEVECSYKGKLIRYLKKGDHFGEISILLESNRTMDVFARTNCILYSISVETLKSMVGESYKEVLLLNFLKMSFAQSKIFKNINLKLLENAFPSFVLEKFQKNEVVISLGHTKSSIIYVVIEGNILNKNTTAVVGERGDILWAEEIFNNSSETVKHDLIADPDTLILKLDSKTFISHLGTSLDNILDKSKTFELLQKIPLFKNFTQLKFEQLAQCIYIETYENGKKIIRQGENGNKFYILKTGKVDIYAGSNYIRTLNEHESFGERALFFKEPRSATAQANGRVDVYVLEESDFQAVMEENLKNYLKNRLLLQDNTIELKDLDFLRTLGCGSFGDVCLVRSRKNNHMYAIKSISKSQIDHESLHENLVLEKSILLKIDHPFIVKLVKTMKDTKNIYFLMEYIRGKELFDVIRDIGLLNKDQTIFYGASMMLAINYLHERKFIYRDIKPENIMVLQSVILINSRVI